MRETPDLVQCNYSITTSYMHTKGKIWALKYKRPRHSKGTLWAKISGPSLDENLQDAGIKGKKGLKSSKKKKKMQLKYKSFYHTFTHFSPPHSTMSCRNHTYICYIPFFLPYHFLIHILLFFHTTHKIFTNPHHNPLITITL